MQIISLSASANKLSTIQKQADEYAALIMEELDPNDKGYILVITILFIILKCIYIYILILNEIELIRLRIWRCCYYKLQTSR